VPIFFSLKHAVTGDSDKHDQFSIIGNWHYIQWHDLY
jgi:hypothetical protein